MSDDRIKLTDNLQRKWFETAMADLSRNLGDLNDYDRRLYLSLRDGYSLAGSEMTVTRKQMNHIKQVAAELETGRY